MPLIDMPLEKLHTYAGRNPRPADFDDYWTAALDAMHDVEPNIELRPASFQVDFAECYNLFFTGVRGARIHAKYIRPKNPSGAGLCEFHGYTGNSGEWNNLLKHTARGMSVVAMDCRGQGGLSQDAGGQRGNTHHGHIIRGLDDDADKLLFRDIFLDCAQLAGILMTMPEVKNNRVGVQGGSQGGALTLACSALEPRVKRAAATFPFLCDYQRVWEMDQAKDAYKELQTYFRHFDPQHKREAEVFTKLGYIDIQHLAPRIKADVLMGVGLMDTICPPSTQFAAYNKIRSTKRLEIYPDFGHENLPGFTDHVYAFMNDL